MKVHAPVAFLAHAFPDPRVIFAGASAAWARGKPVMAAVDAAAIDFRNSLRFISVSSMTSLATAPKVRQAKAILSVTAWSDGFSAGSSTLRAAASWVHLSLPLWPSSSTLRNLGTLFAPPRASAGIEASLPAQPMTNAYIVLFLVVKRTSSAVRSLRLFSLNRWPGTAAVFVPGPSPKIFHGRVL